MAVASVLTGRSGVIACGVKQLYLDSPNWHVPDLDEPHRRAYGLTIRILVKFGEHDDDPF
jgi:hypothetical protein